MNQIKGQPGKAISEWWVENSPSFESYTEALDACVKDLKVKRRSIYKVISRLKRKGADILVRGDKKFSRICSVSSGLSEQELRSKYDPLFKLEQAVKSLVPGKFIPESEFRSTVAIDFSKFRSKADLPKFDAYKGKVQGVTYWGNPKDIGRLKDEGVLS